MSSDNKKEIPEFQALAQGKRKTIAIKTEQKISHLNLVPDELLKDDFLASLISDSLPRNYNFEVHKTIWKIKQTQASRVLLQFPEGLIRFGPVLVNIFNAYFSQGGLRNNVKFITMGDLTYGACCIDDYLASSMGCDLVVHYAHSCLVPINQLNGNMKYLYVFLDIKFDLDHVVKCVEHNFDTKNNRIALASTIQFVASVHKLAGRLREAGFDITVPQSRPLSPGEILGCTAPRLDKKIDTILFVCDGRFHLEALMIANPKIKAFRYDPYSRKLTHESYAFDEMYQQRISAINTTVRIMQEGGTIGIILGTLGRQGSEKVYNNLIERLQSSTTCKIIRVLMPEVIQDTLKEFDTVDVWVQIACPRLSIDWGLFFNSPLLNSYELAQSLKLLMNSKTGTGDIEPGNYPMDFYAKNSCGDHTPNHCCQNNQNCECSV